MQLDADMSDSLKSILRSAAALLDEAHDAYQAGNLTGPQIESVFHLRNDLGQLLARFSDGKAWTGTDGAALNAMRCYEQMAESWLCAVYATVEPHRDDVRRLPSGRYVVTRTRETPTGVISNTITCTNPAVATLQLDLWDAAREAQ